VEYTLLPFLSARSAIEQDKDKQIFQTTKIIFIFFYLHIKKVCFIFVLSKQNNMARKNYSGSDLSNDFKIWARKEFNRLKKILTEKNCTNIQLNYGFYYFSGFFTAPSGQIYYISCSDVRHESYNRLLIRTAKSYSDFTGGQNNFVKTDKESLIKFNLN
jgi:hypothetical protein